MQLHDIIATTNKSKKRIGRGGKRGTTSGRGTKGQKSRSGHRMRPAVRDLILRLPKRRGYANRPKSGKPFIVSLSKIGSKMKILAKGKATADVDKNFLKEIGILPVDFKGEVKILDGKLETAISIKGIKLSKSVREKVEKAGGKIS